MKNNKVYVVAVTIEGGKKLYFVKETHETVECLGKRLMSVVKGVFSRDVKDAKKYLVKEQAEWTASYFDDASVDTITEVERLK